jgi:hypothetical protein
MRENRLSGSEGGATVIPSSLPLSIIQSLRDKEDLNILGDAKSTARLKTGAKSFKWLATSSARRVLRPTGAGPHPFDALNACSGQASHLFTSHSY